MSRAPDPIELLTGDAADLPVVAEIMAEAFDPRFGEAWTTAQCLGMFALTGVWLTLARRDGIFVGFALSRVIAGDGELLLLAVRPSARRRGVGAALLRTVISEAILRSASRLHLEVRAGNRAAELYRSQEFEKIGTRKDYYRGISGEMFSAETYSRRLVN